LIPVLTIDLDVACLFHGQAKDRDTKQFLFGDPPKLSGNIGEHDKDVEAALMIGHKNLGPIPQDMFDPQDLHFHPRQL